MNNNNEIIEDLIAIKAANYTINEAILNMTNANKNRISGELNLITATLDDLLDKNISLVNKEELYLFTIALKQIRLMIMELFEECKRSI